MTDTGNVVDKLIESENATLGAAIKKPKPQTVADIDLELKQLELEEKRLAVEAARANLIDTRERLDERELKREAVRERSRMNGATIKQLNVIESARQTNCNHHKGGNGLQDYTSGQGDDTQYAVRKHKFANGDIQVACMRCHKRWNKPAKADYKTEESYTAAMDEYRKAVNFTTKNVMSSSYEFRFSDDGEFYRNSVKNS